MSIWNETFAMFEKLRASKLNSMMAAINAHAHGTIYYTKGEVDGLDFTKVKATSVDPTAGYLDGKVDDTTVKVTSNQLTVGNIFGAWEIKAEDTAYLAITDGFVTALGKPGSETWLYGYTDSNNPPTTKRVQQWHDSAHPIRSSIMFPVKKNDYWKVTNSDTVYWLPIGS